MNEARFPIIKAKNNIKTTSEMTLPAGTYTVCVLSVANGVYARGADVDHTYDSNKHTFTLARQTAITLDSYWGKGRPEKDENIWLVEGNEWRPYTPYIGSTNTLTLPETVYGGEVDAVSGDGQETWKTLTLDGTEMWDKYGSVSEKAGASCFYFNIDDKDIGYGTSVCNKFVNTKNSNPFLNTNMKKFTYTGHPNIKNIYMNYGDDQTVPLDEWKAYLAAQYAAGTPVQICYRLAEPVPFTATGAQPLSALAGVNTVLTDADSATVTGRADPIKRITDSEDAVASIN